MLILWLAIRPARGGTRVLLVAEGITVALILIVIVIVFAKLAGHSGPGKLGLTGSAFSLPSGTPTLDDLPRRRVRIPVLRRLRGGLHAW